MTRKKKRKSLILTPKELEVINKKLSGTKLTQQDSNYLSKFIRPKLKEIDLINARALLNQLTYNQKAISIENRIKKTILKNLEDVDSITLYGSAIQNNYIKYNDVDVLVVVKKKSWKKLGEKYRKILKIKKQAKKHSINLDLEIYDKKTFQGSYYSNASLIYQLKDKKTIYGKLRLINKIEIPKLDLRMKMDYSILEDENVKGLEIYKAIRNLALINLILKKIINNKKLNNLVSEEIGENLITKLKKNKESVIERKISLLHLKRLLKSTFKKIEGVKWEKIVLSNL